MNKRQVALLKKLIIEDDYQPIKYFADIFNVSVKTISKDLDKIDEIINDIGVNLDRKQGLGIKLYYTPSQLDELNILLNNIKISNGDRDLEYRRIEILLNLLINTNQYTTIQKLSDKYMVSRTSINNDLNEIQQSLSKYNLKLSKTLKGTRVVGSEINIRKALVSTIQEYGKINPNYIAKYQNIRHKELKINEINTIINKKSIAFFEKLLNELETKLKLVIYEPYYTNLLTHLVIMTNRILNGNYINDNSDLKDIVYIANNELYNSAIYLIEEIEKRFQIRINIEEIAYIYKYLTSIGLSFDDDKKEYIKKPDLPYIYFTKDLIDTISEMSDVNYNSRVGFYDRLLLHIKPMLNRTKYNIQIKNPLLKEFLREFEEEFFIAKIACFLICNKYEVNMISDHEVAYILSYFISEDEKIAETIKIKTVVICHSGYGLPIVLNPVTVIPFIGVPLMNTILSAIAFETRFLPYTNGVALPWTTPLGFSLTKNISINLMLNHNPVKFDKHSLLVKTLQRVYEEVTHLDGAPVTTTGGTYAKVMPNIVPFGPSFPGQRGIAHNPNEYMDINDIILNTKIFAQGIYSLAKSI